jgi:hypothetical protein
VVSCERRLVDRQPLSAADKLRVKDTPAARRIADEPLVGLGVDLEAGALRNELLKLRENA